MDRSTAYRILSQALDKFRKLEFSALVLLIGTTSSEEYKEPGKALYIVDITVSWLGSQHNSVLVQGRIDEANSFHFSSLEEKIIVHRVSA